MVISRDRFGRFNTDKKFIFSLHSFKIEKGEKKHDAISITPKVIDSDAIQKHIV